MAEEEIQIRKKEFTYRGKTMEQLKELDVREFAKYLKSKARRVVLRRFNEIERFVSRAKKRMSKKKPIKTHQRDLIIVPEMIGMRIQVYNGKTFVPVDITGEMLGHRFGEFSLTRGKVKHGTVGIGATKGTKSRAKK